MPPPTRCRHHHNRSGGRHTESVEGNVADINSRVPCLMVLATLLYIPTVWLTQLADLGHTHRYSRTEALWTALGMKRLFSEWVVWLT